MTERLLGGRPSVDDGGRVPTDDTDRKLLCRNAAFIHNCYRFNKLALLDLVNKPVHDRITKLDGMTWTSDSIKLAASLMLLMFMPVGYATASCSNSTEDIPAGSWQADGCKLLTSWTGLGIGTLTIVVGFVLSAFFQIVVAKCLMTVHTGPDDSRRLNPSPGKYWVAWWFYYILYKLWQKHVILPYAGGLVYNNRNLFATHPTLSHVGVFVVGVAVNIVQAIIFMFLVLAYITKNPLLVTVVGYAIIRAALLALDLVLSPNAHIRAVIDKAIADHDCGEIFKRMNGDSFAVTKEELQKLRVLRGKNFALTTPSSTHVMTVAYKSESRQNWLAVNLADGESKEMTDPEI